MLEAQNRRIDDLLERIRLQQEKLDKQNVRIRTLQSQVRSKLRTTPPHVPVFNFAIYSFFLKKKSHSFFSELFFGLVSEQVQQSRQSSGSDATVEQRDAPVGEC